MSIKEENVLLKTIDSDGDTMVMYPVTKAECVEGFESTDKRYATFVIGTTTSGHTAENVDYLCTGSGDQKIINQAIEDLPVNGGKIVILEGTYNLGGQITFQRDNITIEGMGNSTVLNRTSTATYSYVFFLESCNYCNISNLKQTGGWLGICLYKCNYCKISNVIITAAGGMGGISIETAQNTTTIGNEILNCILYSNSVSIFGDINLTTSSLRTKVIGNTCLSKFGIISVSASSVISNNIMTSIESYGSNSIVENNVIV